VLAYRVDNTIPLSDKMKRVSAFILEDSDVEIRPINVKKLKEEARMIREIYNDAWRAERYKTFRIMGKAL
jgi:hypothetical protein